LSSGNKRKGTEKIASNKTHENRKGKTRASSSKGVGGAPKGPPKTRRRDYSSTTQTGRAMPVEGEGKGEQKTTHSPGIQEEGRGLWGADEKTKAKSNERKGEHQRYQPGTYREPAKRGGKRKNRGRLEKKCRNSSRRQNKATGRRGHLEVGVRREETISKTETNRTLSLENCSKLWDSDKREKVQKPGGREPPVS